MADLIKLTANTLTEFLSHVMQINQTERGSVWYRGQANAAYQLTPSVLRETTPLNDQFGRRIHGPINASGNTVTGLCAERMLDEFKRRARAFITETPRNEFEWLFLMQHYGTPTRLLDWTTNALVALYFATEYLSPRVHKSDPDAAEKFPTNDELRHDGFSVYCINPSKINQELHGIPHPLDIAEAGGQWAAYVRPMEGIATNTYAPVCILAPHNSPRIRAQSGTFTLHGSNVWAIDYYDVLRPHIYKIFFPYSCLLDLNRDLRGIGLTASFIYPDLSGLSREITLNETALHAQEMESLSGGRFGDQRGLK